MGSTLTGYAQQESSDQDHKKHKDQLILDLNHETLLGAPNDVNFKWYNRGLNVQIMYDFPVVEGRLSIGFGGGFSTQNYYSDSYLARESRDGIGYTYWEKREEDYRRNKLSVNHLEVPFELRYRSNPLTRKYQWRIAVGFKYGTLIDVHDKLIDNDRNKFKTYVFPDVLDYRMGPTLRVGYGKVVLFGYYSITEFFKSGQGPTMNQLSIGIGMMPF